jgi:hypothetical protein
MPTARLGKAQKPSLFVCVVCVTFVAALVTETGALGTRLPVASFTVPEMLPLLLWAQATPQLKRIRKTAELTIPTLDFRYPLIGIPLQVQSSRDAQEWLAGEAVPDHDGQEIAAPKV